MQDLLEGQDITSCFTIDIYIFSRYLSFIWFSVKVDLWKKFKMGLT